MECFVVVVFFAVLSPTFYLCIVKAIAEFLKNMVESNFSPSVATGYKMNTFSI